ncbi:MAG: HAD-IIIC family phosphatase [Planctomycetaceae bacterium]
MDESLNAFRFSFSKSTFSVFYLMVYATLASGTLAGGIYASGLVNVLPVWAIITLTPALYLAWLVLFLGWGFVIGIPFYALAYRRSPRLSSSKSNAEQARFITQLMLYLKCSMIQSLPMARSLQTLSSWQQLVFRGYSPKNKIHRDAHVWGILWDPDLTEIGQDSLVGGDATITCHAVTVQTDGSFEYACAPVVIGRRVTVGGQCRINLGVQIGDDSVVEAGSNVLPYTIIPANEIWGGNPAQFLRPRLNQRQNEPESTVALKLVSNDQESNLKSETSDDDRVLAVRKLVAETLHHSLEEVTPRATMEEISDWDSLGQMGIAAGIYSRFGIKVGAAESFCLRSIPDILRLLDRHKGNSLSNTETDEPLPRDPELLPLWDHEKATRLLARQVEQLKAPEGNELRVVIASTFTAESIAASLQLWARAFGMNIKVEFAGFNQVAQELLSPISLFRSNRTGLNIVLSRPEDLLAEDRASSAESLLDAIERFSRDANGTLVVGTLPPVVSQIVNVDRQTAETVRASWRQKLSGLSDVTLLDFSAVVEGVGVSAACDTENEVIARSPYSAAVYRELGIELSRLVRQRRVAPAKVVAVDADGVLWGGVIAEDGIDGIHLGTDHPGRSFRLFQQYLKSLKAKGQLLVLVSRNQPEDVWKVLDQHPEMVLRREDFTSARINWLPKSENVKDIAKELNLGLDAFVFIDDDVANRLEMAANAPGVTVVPLPVDAAQYVPMISRLWRFDAAQLTAEDQARAAMMQQEQERKRLQENTGDLQSYLESLSLRVVMRSAKDIDLPRVAQLTQKTNQFNLSLKRRSLSEVRDLGDRFAIHVIEASDRFGDYGLVGVAILERPEREGDAHQLDTLLMSCRVLGRGVEEATLHGLTSIVVAEGGTRLEAPVVIGPRNQPILEFLSRSGFVAQEEQLHVLAVETSFPLPAHIDWNDAATIALPGSHRGSVAA